MFIEIALQDIAGKFVEQIKHFSLQIKRDESLTRRFNPVQIKVEICVTFCISSPVLLDWTQNKQGVTWLLIQSSVLSRASENLVVEVFEVRIQFVGCENARKI